VNECIGILIPEIDTAPVGAHPHIAVDIAENGINGIIAEAVVVGIVLQGSAEGAGGFVENTDARFGAYPKVAIVVAGDDNTTL